MGTITAGIGLISGIDTAKLIEALITLESKGKFALQNRVIKLQSQQAAMIDINARLLNLKNTAKNFKSQSIFQSALATSSNESIFTATATSKAQPGTFSFVVKQLAATSQKLSKGFNDANVTPLGLEFLNFNFGKGNLDRDRKLSELNGGNGVAAGNIAITDKSGSTATINLTDVTTIGDVLDRINQNTQIAVEVRLDGDRLMVEDKSGGGGTFTIANAGSATTASDLGIAGSAANGTLNGTKINTLGAATSLAALRDGLGVLIQNNVPDLQIIARDGTIHNIDLGQVNKPLSGDTLLKDLNNGAGIAISSDHNNPDIKFVDRNGVTHEVNLTGVTTLGQLINRVASETDGKISLSITDGKQLTVTDNTGGDGTLKVFGAGTNDTKTATDLGILKEDGVEADSFTGTAIPNTISTPAATTIGQVIERITAQTNGKVVASIAADGVSIELTDTTGSAASNLIVKSTAGNPHAATQLGIKTGDEGIASAELEGERLIAHLGSVLVSNLNGGSGLGGATTLSITDRAGNSFTINNLNSFHSLDQIIAHLNSEAASEGVAIAASLNSSGTGLLITDTSGSSASNLIIAGDAAAALGIETDPDGVAEAMVGGTNLHLKYVGHATKLSELNYGKGIGHGSFKITDGFGKTATFNINANQKTLADVIQVINAQAGGANGLAIKARLNDTGTGILIEQDLTDKEPGQNPFVPLKVESVSGSTAKDLGILGQSKTVQDAKIDGSYMKTVELSASDSLEQVVKKINDAGIPISASILNTGAGSNAFRLNLTSSIGGALGELIIDSGGVDLGLTTLSKGQDAKVFFGSPESGGFLITSQTNQIKDVLDGVTLNLKQVSDEPVTVTVTRDTEKIKAAVGQFVNSFNEAIAKISDYDFFDVENETRGVLLGNPTTSRVKNALYRAFRQQAEGVGTQYQFLSQIGIRIGANGLAEFDEAKFAAAYESDPVAVENLFTAFETSTQPPQEFAPGISIGSSSSQTTARGISAIFEDLLDGLTDPLDGTLTLADNNFKSQLKIIKDRIEAFEQRLEAKQQRLERQFLAMESALAKLQGQGNALTSLAMNIQLAGAMFK